MRLFKRILLGVSGVIAAGLLYDLATRPTFDAQAVATSSGQSAQPGAAFNGATFASESYAKKRPTDLLRWQLNRNQGPWETRPTDVAQSLPAHHFDGVRVTLVNHSTLLIQTHGVNVLTDPIWSEAAGPGGRIGPRRFREPGIRFGDLPPIDAVFVSHSHYDHMDLPTLGRLHTEHNPVFVVGLGNADNLAKAGIERHRVEERDWWQAVELNHDVSLLVTPARHWSKRSALDTNRTLWGSFVLRHAQQPLLFFAGDTGFGSHFSDIQQDVGDVPVALMPIGAYLPRWFMQDNHLSPSDALKAASDLGSSVIIPIHFGTFALGDDGQDEPLVELLNAYEDASDDAPEARVLDHGQHTVITLDQRDLNARQDTSD